MNTTALAALALSNCDWTGEYEDAEDMYGDVAAKWLAQDEDGCWYVFREEPLNEEPLTEDSSVDGDGYWSQEGDGTYLEFIGEGSEPTNWKQMKFKL